MVSTGRVACIATPFALSLLALVTLVLIFLAGTIQNNATVGDLYFLKIDLSDFTLSTTDGLLGSSFNTTLPAGTADAAKDALKIQDYYTIYLRSYCAWSGNGAYSFCSKPQSYFWFNPLSVWGLTDSGLDQSIIPKQFQDGLNAYKATSKALFVLYAAALTGSAATLLIGLSAMFSRWGSFFTTFLAAAAGISYIGAAAVMTTLFVTLRNVLNKEFEDTYRIKTDVGKRVQYIAWAGVALSMGAGLFWLLSVCFCSGKSPYNPGSKEARRTRAEKTPYHYERVGSPFQGDHQQQQFNQKASDGKNEQQGYQMNTFYRSQAPQRDQHQTAYEPFRSQQV